MASHLGSSNDSNFNNPDYLSLPLLDFCSQEDRLIHATCRDARYVGNLGKIGDMTLCHL